MYEKTESTTSVGEPAVELPRKNAGSETQQVTMTTTQRIQAPEGRERNLLELILRVIAHWPCLDGNDLTLRLTRLPGAASCGGRRFLSLLLPEELLKRFELGFFLSCAGGMPVSAYGACVRHAGKGRKQDCCPCTQFFAPQQPVHHTAGREAPGTPFLDTSKQSLVSAYFGHLTKEPSAGA